jgi:membrane dipeptidase
MIALSGADLKDSETSGISVFVLGVEGGDCIGEDLSRLSTLHQEGVRVFQPMHYSKNQIGSISYGWGGRIVPAEEQTGLSSFGRKLLSEAERLHLIVDLAHADERTTLDAASRAEAPLICSHTGPRALQDFPRYLSDEALKAVAGTGGIIGLWPFLHKGRGVKDLDEFILYAKYIADLLGVEHLSLGTDINGVPGNMRGYKNLNDSAVLIQALETGGFNDEEIRLIAGGNFLSLFDRIT